jgi:hypothetical protein
MRTRGFDCEPLDPAVEGGHDDYLARTPHDAELLETAWARANVREAIREEPW